MKAAILFFLSVSATTALACAPGDGTQEAQFSGHAKVVAHGADQKGRQFTQITLTLDGVYTVNPNCPLDQGQAEGAVVTLPGHISLTSRSEVSGVLVYNSATKMYHIE
jgi:hypothetical protein